MLITTMIHPHHHLHCISAATLSAPVSPRAQASINLDSLPAMTEPASQDSASTQECGLSADSKAVSPAKWHPTEDELRYYCQVGPHVQIVIPPGGLPTAAAAGARKLKASSKNLEPDDENANAHCQKKPRPGTASSSFFQGPSVVMVEDPGTASSTGAQEAMGTENLKAAKPKPKTTFTSE